MAQSIDFLMEIHNGMRWEVEMQTILDKNGNAGELFAVAGPEEHYFVLGYLCHAPTVPPPVTLSNSREKKMEIPLSCF